MSQHVSPCDTSPCRACPWRVSNHGKDSPLVEGYRFGWYTDANLKRLWGGLRKGEMMSCHPTDSRQVQVTGRTIPEDVQTKTCAGAVILVFRELERLQDCRGDIKKYSSVMPVGLNRTGMRVFYEQIIFGRTGLSRNIGNPNLNESDVQYTPLGEWTPRGVV